MTTARVLLVEDNPGDARLIVETLKEVTGAKFEVTSVSTLAAALEQRPWHAVVLLDLSLPDAHGLETVARMTEGSNVPVVVLTGTNDDELARRAVHAGAQDYLVKGEVTPLLLSRTLRYAIERSRAEEDAQLARDVRRSRFLLQVGTELSMSLDVGEMAQRLGRLLVPHVADACSIECASDTGALERIATMGVEIAGADAHASRVVPLAIGDRVIGALTLWRFGRASPFGEDDRLLFEEVAIRAALSLDNARLYRNAQQALRARDEMLAVVSHDLRNPLSVIGLSLQTLAPAVVHDGMRASTLKRAQNAFERMRRLIDDLLDLARIDQGTLKIDRTAQPIAGLLGEHVETHRPIADDRGITLEFVSQADAIVDVDRERIGQVISNLVGNALKFTPRGGAVRVRTQCVGRGVQVAVEDNGSGIAADALPHIFERGYQHGANAARQGVGLGLVITKGIVEAHGGTIDVASTIGVGTTVRFTLPVTNRPAEAAAAP